MKCIALVLAVLLVLGTGCALADRRGWEVPPAVSAALPHVRDAVDAAADASTGTPLGEILAAASLVLGLGGAALGVSGKREARDVRETARAELARAIDEQKKDRAALAITMGALEHAPPEARHLARDAARKEHLSAHLEDMIARGWVRDVSAPPAKEAS